MGEKGGKGERSGRGETPGMGVVSLVGLVGFVCLVYLVRLGEGPGSRIVSHQTMKECNADPRECNNQPLTILSCVALHSFATGPRVLDQDRPRDHLSSNQTRRAGSYPEEKKGSGVFF